MSIKLNATIRGVAGKGAARKVRKENKIPAVIYGEKKDPTAIALDAKTWREMIKKPGLRTKLFEIDTDNGKENAMLMDIQYHPVSDLPIHVDFKRIDVANPVSVSVPLHLINAESARGVKVGGVLNFAVRNVLISAIVHDIPESIDVDIIDLPVGGVIHGSDLTLPKGVSLGLHMDELTFVTIGGKMAEEAETAPKAAAAAAPAAGAAKAAAPAKDAKAAPAAAKPAAKK